MVRKTSKVKRLKRRIHIWATLCLIAVLLGAGGTGYFYFTSNFFMETAVEFAKQLNALRQICPEQSNLPFTGNKSL